MNWVSNRIAAVLIATVALICAIMLLPVQALVARAQGFVILIDQSSRKLSVPAGQTISTTFRLKNVLNRSVSIAGVETGCSCTKVDPMPLMLPSMGSADVTFHFDMSKSASGELFVSEPVFFVDCPGPKLSLKIEINVE